MTDGDRSKGQRNLLEVFPTDQIWDNLRIKNEPSDYMMNIMDCITLN